MKINQQLNTISLTELCKYIISQLPTRKVVFPLNYKMIVMNAFEHLKFVTTDPTSLFWGNLTGILLFLIGQPTLALYALLALLIFDIMTRLRANALNNGGYINATREGKIQSRRLFTGFFSKFFAYSIVLSLANMAQYFIPIEMIAAAIYTVVTCVLFWVEVQSILENLLDAEPVDSKNRKLYNILLFVFRQKTEEFIGFDIETASQSQEEQKPEQ